MGLEKYLTYVNLARWNYINGAMWLAMMLFDMDSFAWGVGLETKLFESTNMKAFMNLFRSLCFSFVMYWIAVSQCSDNTIRKHLQYALPIGPAICVVMVAARNEIGWHAIQMNLLVQGMTALVTLYTLYGINKSAPSKYGSSARMTNFFRVLYCVKFVMAVWLLANPENMFEYFGMGVDSFIMARFMGFFIMGKVLLFVASTQSSEVDQRKILQYAILSSLADMVATAYNGDVYMGSSYPAVCQQWWACNVLTLLATIYVAYPATWKVQIFRFQYVLGVGNIILLWCNPPLCWKLWKTTEHTPEASAFIMGLLAMQVSAQMAISQLSDDSQAKFLKYSILPISYMVVMSYFGKLNLWSAAPLQIGLVTFILLVLYTPKYPVFDFFREGRSSTSTMKASPMMKKMKKA